MARTKRLATAFASVALALPLLSTGPAGAAVVNPTSISTWYEGETHTLRWGTLTGTAGTFSIELRDASGQIDADPSTPEMDPIVSGLNSATVGSYDWTIPTGLAGANRVIRIVGTGSTKWAGGNTNVDSDAFTIDTLTSGFLSPAPGSEVRPGGSVTVKFVVPSVDATGTAEIGLSKNGVPVDLDPETTGDQDTIATGLDLSAVSTYSWTVPSSLSGTGYRLVLRAGTSGSYTGSAIQSGQFSAVPAGIYEPSSTSNWRELEQKTIQWSAPVGAAGTVAIYLWDGTANVDADPTTNGTQPIATGLDISTTTSYTWTIPAGITLSNTARIRIVGDGGAGQYTGSAMVSSPFILRAAPPVPRFTVPAAGNRWHPGESHTITWVVAEDATGKADVWLYDINGKVDLDPGTTGVQPFLNDVDVTTVTSQSWTIPAGLTGTRFAFNVEPTGALTGDYTGQQVTSGEFSIYPVGVADVSIDSAVGRQVAISEKFDISWHDDGATGATVDIDLIRNDGDTTATTTSIVKGLAKSTVCNAVTHDCKYTATLSDKTTLDTNSLARTYKVRVTPALGVSAKSTTFSVVDRALNETPWSGNKTAKTGEPVKVEWTPQGNLGALKIEAVPATGTAVVLEKAYDGSKGSYTWYPSYAFSGDYSLRVTAAAKTAKKEAITATWTKVTVTKATAITVTSSLGGVTGGSASLGQPITVAWNFGEALNATTKASPAVDINLLDGAKKATKVAAGVMGDFDDNGKALRTYTFRPSGKVKPGNYTVQVLVTGSTDAGLKGETEAVALAAPTSLTLNKPATSANVERGGSLDVEWTWDGKSDLPVTINLLDANSKATALLKSAVGKEGNGKGKATVTIPAKGTSAGSYKIQVISDDLKTIKAEKAVTLTTPTLAITTQKTVNTTKAVVYKGKPTEVGWTLGEAGALPVKLEVIAAADKAATKPKVLETINAAAKTVEGEGTVTWSPSAKLAAGDYVIRATAGDLSATGVMSDTFTLAVADVDTVTAPTGAQVGKASTIKWTLDQEATDSVKIELVSGSTVVAKGGLISKSSTATLGYGSYSWTIPSTIAAGSYKIRVTSLSDATKTLDSDTFSIAAAS